MMLKLKLRQTGNSIGLVLPKEALEHLGAREGDTVFLNFVAEGALRVSTADPEFEKVVETAEEVNRQYGDSIRALIRRSIQPRPINGATPAST